MKRFRVKAVGLGLALAAGAAVAADGGWPPPDQPASSVAPTGAPGLLPPSVRGTPAPAKADNGPVWLPARESPPATITPVGGVQQPVSVTPPQPVGPRLNDPFGALPAIPVPSNAAVQLPPVPEIPVAPQPVVSQPMPQPTQPVKQPDALPQPRPADPTMVPPPHPPGYLPLPAPRPLDGQPLPSPQPELPPAPGNLLHPVGLEVGKHATFGSPPIRLSRDYPPVRDLIQHGHYQNGITIADDGVDGEGGTMSRFFLSGEYLLWWMPGYPTPVLATTNPNGALNGFLGEPGTTALVGPGPLIGSTRSGFRVRAGAWLDDCGACGIDGSFFFLGRRSESIVIGSDRFPLVTRPIFAPNVLPGTDTPLGENGEAVAVPGILRGSVAVRGDSQLWGADVNLRKSLCCTCNTHAEVFAGYRHLNLRESLTITENITVVGDGGTRIATDPIGTRVVVQDQFSTRNYFHGGQIGALYERQFGRWELDARASIALGSTHQVLEISGFQVRQQPGLPAMTFTGGLLAAGPNLGLFTRDRFSVAPEFTLNFGYRLTDNIRLFAGYNFLLWTNVIRPGDQIDRVVDLTFVPNSPPGIPFSGQNRPQPLFKQRDLVINGIQIGLDWRW